MGDEPVARRQDDFLAESEVFLEEGGDDQLDGAALCTVDVHEVDLGRIALQVLAKLDSQRVHTFELGGISGSQRTAHEALMPDLHTRSFTAASATS